MSSPADLILKKVTTRTTDNYEVPCFESVSGSWYVGICSFVYFCFYCLTLSSSLPCCSSTVPLCDAIATAPELICPLLPPSIPCECPIKAGTYQSPDSTLSFSSEWNNPANIPGGANVIFQFRNS